MGNVTITWLISAFQANNTMDVKRHAKKLILNFLLVRQKALLFPEKNNHITGMINVLSTTQNEGVKVVRIKIMISKLGKQFKTKQTQGT